MNELEDYFRQARRDQIAWQRYVVEFRRDLQIVDQNKMIQKERSEK